MRSQLLAALVAVAALAGCGGDDTQSTTEKQQPVVAGTDLTPVKDYLLDHTARLQDDTARLLAAHRAEVASLVKDMQATYIAANPAYEEMEGVVAGVPSLADYDVIIDAGGDASDPENAVPFSIRTPDGRTFKQPGNFNYLIETSIFGTEPKFAAKGVKPDLDGDGKVEFGEAMPDANFFVAAARDFETQANELD